MGRFKGAEDVEKVEKVEVLVEGVRVAPVSFMAGGLKGLGRDVMLEEW